jgi:hypothetical protein
MQQRQLAPVKKMHFDIQIEVGTAVYSEKTYLLQQFVEGKL